MTTNLELQNMSLSELYDVKKRVDRLIEETETEIRQKQTKTDRNGQ